jgi:hypothetical protein
VSAPTHPSSKERVDLQKIIDQLRAAASFARNKIVMPDVESGKLMDAAASAIEYARQVADASVDVQFERGCYVLMEMMKAYERRIRSDCTTQEQLDAKPWECSEYITAARYLVKFWPPYSSTRAAEPPREGYSQAYADQMRTALLRIAGWREIDRNSLGERLREIEEIALAALMPTVTKGAGQ